jgi:hypothetical protein
MARILSSPEKQSESNVVKTRDQLAFFQLNTVLKGIEKESHKLIHPWMGLFDSIYQVTRASWRAVRKWVTTRFIPIPEILYDHDSRKIRIAVELSGGFGDFANRLVFLNSFQEKYASDRIDIFSNNSDLVRSLYGSQDFFFRSMEWETLNRFDRYYDLVFYATDWLRVKVRRSGKIRKHLPTLWQDLEATRDRRAWLDVFVRKDLSLDGVFARAMSQKGLDVARATGYFIGLEGNLDRHFRSNFQPSVSLPVVEKLTRYITVHDGVGATVKSGVSTKQWMMASWVTLVQMLKKAFPDITIVQIGGPLSRSIAGVDIDLVGKLSVTESLGVLAGSTLHVDGESGHVRLAYSLGVRSVVLFGPTPTYYYPLPGNINVFPHLCGGCAYIRTDWSLRCPRGLETPECLESISPKEVFESILGSGALT